MHLRVLDHVVPTVLVDRTVERRRIGSFSRWWA